MSSNSAGVVKRNHSVIFTGQPRQRHSKQHLSSGLLSLCGGIPAKANALYQKAPVRVAKNLTKPQAEATLKKFWAAGWHVDLYAGKSCVYSSQHREGSALSVPGIATGAGSLGKLATEKSIASGSLQTIRFKRVYAQGKDISLCIPSTWETKAHLNGEAILQVGRDQDEIYLIVIAQEKHSFGAVVRLQEYASAIVSAALGWVAKSTLIASARYNEVGRYSRAEIAGLIGTTQVQYQITTFESKKKFYTVYVWTNAERYKLARPLINAIIESFKVSEQGNQACVKSVV